MTTPYLTESASAASSPAGTSILKYSMEENSFDVTWKEVKNVSGYQIQYADNRFFLNAKTKTIDDVSTTSCTVSTDSISPCYFRIRTYLKREDSAAAYSGWALSGNCKVSKEAIINQLNVGSKPFELTSASRQSIGKYDTLQGGCAYKDTGWFILYNRKVSKCKIAKVDLNTMKIIKVSGVLKISHGNCMSYNPSTNKLVVAHGPKQYKKVSIVDPTKLTVTKCVTLRLSAKTPGASKKYARKFKGVTSLTYNAEKKTYVGRVRGYNHLVMYNSNLKPVKYIRLKYGTKQLYQSIDSFDNYILVAQSPNKYGKYNQILVYDWNGNYQSTVKLSKRYELETVFHSNGQLYAGYYTSYYKTYYLDRFKIKVYKGKKSKIKTIFKYSKLMRENFIFKVTDL